MRDWYGHISFTHMGPTVKIPDISLQPITDVQPLTSKVESKSPMEQGGMERHINVLGNQRRIQLPPHSWAPECQNLLESTQMSGFPASEFIRCSVYLQWSEVFLDSIELYHWDREEKAHSNSSPKPHRLGNGGLLILWNLEGKIEGQLRVCPTSEVVSLCYLLFPKSFLLMIL